jgi:hypothetical protein
MSQHPTRFIEEAGLEIARELLDSGFWLEEREPAKDDREAKYAVFNRDGDLMVMVRGKARAEAAAAEIAKSGT